MLPSLMSAIKSQTISNGLTNDGVKKTLGKMQGIAQLNKMKRIDSYLKAGMGVELDEDGSEACKNGCTLLVLPFLPSSLAEKFPFPSSLESQTKIIEANKKLNRLTNSLNHQTPYINYSK
jgi:hypothetical protein